MTSELRNGFLMGLGFAAAFAAWGLLQMLWHRAEGGH